MNKVQEMKLQWFRECREQDPDRYQDILDHECPDDYGLPSFMDTRTCNKHTCDECWKEALKDGNS